MMKDVQAGMRLQRAFTSFSDKIKKSHGQEMTPHRVKGLLYQLKHLEWLVKEAVGNMVLDERRENDG